MKSKVQLRCPRCFNVRYDWERDRYDDCYYCGHRVEVNKVLDEAETDINEFGPHFYYVVVSMATDGQITSRMTPSEYKVFKRAIEHSYDGGMIKISGDLNSHPSCQEIRVNKSNILSIDVTKIAGGIPKEVTE